MGVYKSAIVTEAGQSLIAQAIAGEGELLFSSAKTSSYAYPEGTNIAALTGLQDIVQSVTPFSSQVFNDTVVQVSSRFSNEDVTSAYMIQTLGLYAQLNGGAETLFAVVQATTPDQVPVQSSVSPSAFIFNVQMTIQQASQITVTVNPAGTATVQDVLNTQNDIAALENPEFDDSGTVSTITDYNSFYNSIVSKMSIFTFFRNLKAGLKFMLNVGQLVTDTATNNDDLVAAASAVYKNAQAISSLNAHKAEAVYVNDLFTVDTNGLFTYYDEYTANTPYKAGLSSASEGVAIITGSPTGWKSILCVPKSGMEFQVHLTVSGEALGWFKIALTKAE